jgi:hypothetical protein
MVDRDYVLEKKPPPGRWKVFLDQQVVPTAIDAAATAEAGVEFVSVRTREAPIAMLMVAFGLSFLGSYLSTARRA